MVKDVFEDELGAGDVDTTNTTLVAAVTSTRYHETMKQSLLTRTHRIAYHTLCHRSSVKRGHRSTSNSLIIV